MLENNAINDKVRIAMNSEETCPTIEGTRSFVNLPDPFPILLLPCTMRALATVSEAIRGKLDVKRWGVDCLRLSPAERDPLRGVLTS